MTCSTAPQARFRVWAARRCAVAGSLALVWLIPTDAFAQDFTGLFEMLGRASLQAAAVFYGALTWRAARGRSWQLGLTALHVLIAISPYALSQTHVSGTHNEIGVLMLLNLAACLPLACALAATRRWAELSALLVLGSWMLPPVLAFAAPYAIWGWQLLGWLLRPIGVIPV